MQLMKQRRSIFPKDFNGASVPRAVIERALEAANWAPTHGKTEGDDTPSSAAAGLVPVAQLDLRRRVP